MIVGGIVFFSSKTDFSPSVPNGIILASSSKSYSQNDSMLVGGIINKKSAGKNNRI